jgi:hypothetical protein
MILNPGKNGARRNYRSSHVRSRFCARSCPFMSVHPVYLIKSSSLALKPLLMSLEVSQRAAGMTGRLGRVDSRSVAKLCVVL